MSKEVEHYIAEMVDDFTPQSSKKRRKFTMKEESPKRRPLQRDNSKESSSTNGNKFHISKVSQDKMLKEIMSDKEQLSVGILFDQTGKLRFDNFEDKFGEIKKLMKIKDRNRVYL